MGNRDNLGDQILGAVEEILASGNLDKLNSVVSDTVAKAMDETRKQLEAAAKAARESVDRTNVTRNVNATRTTTEDKSGKEQRSSAKTTATQTVSKTKANEGRFSSTAQPVYRNVTAPRAKVKKIGSAASVLFQVFGGIGTAFFGFLFFVFAVGNALEPGYWTPVIVLGVFLALSIGFIYLGAGKRARLRRAERYIQVMQGKSYINISELALLTNKSEEYVRKEVKKMIHSGIFPEGHLDMQEECLIVGDVAYREYLRLEKSRRALASEMEEQKRIEALNAQKEAERAAQEKAAEAEGNAELAAMVQEGNECIRQLRDLNDAIEGEAISTKLFHLENLLKEIFEQVKEHPEQMPEMHKFMNYYLPTTLKLVTAYEEFDRVSVPGEDILDSKREIEKTLDTINMAFEELLNKLFRDRVFDVTTDAQVLKTMLAKEGLTREPVFANRTTKAESEVLRKELK